MKKVSKKELIDIKKNLIFRFKEKIVLGKQLEVIRIAF